jgi:hypothetical protein
MVNANSTACLVPDAEGEDIYRVVGAMLPGVALVAAEQVDARLFNQRMALFPLGAYIFA